MHIRKLARVLIYSTIFIISTFTVAVAQEVSQQDIEQAECFVKALKPFMNRNLEIWRVARTGNDEANRGIEPHRIEHPCGANQPQYGFYTLQQVELNIQKFSSFINQHKGKSSSKSDDGMKQETLPSYYSGLDQNPNNIMEGLQREFDPKGFAQTKYRQTLQEQGMNFVNGLVQQLEQNNYLIETNDPAELLADFNRKFSNLESIQANYQKGAFNFGYQRGQQLADQIAGKDYEAIAINSLTFIETLGNMRRAEKELERSKKLLEQQKKDRMYELYRMTVESTFEIRENYVKRAAFAESRTVEQNNLNYVFHLNCYIDALYTRFNAGYSDWNINRCNMPEMDSISEIPNNLISKDRQLMDIAERKFALYERLEESIYIDGAISFAATAVKENPTAENYYRLGEFYAKRNQILALVFLKTASSLKPEYITSAKQKFIDEIEKNTNESVRNAITVNNTDYLQLFVKSGAHELIRFNGLTLLSYALSLDEPDAVQVILNEQAEGLEPTELETSLQNSVMLAAASNSIKTFERLSELGISLNFELNGRSPIDIASEYLSLDAYAFLLERSDKKSLYDQKYSSSKIAVLYNAESNPEKSIEIIESALSMGEVETISVLMVENLAEKPWFVSVLGGSQKARSIVKQYRDINLEVKKQFVDQTKISSPSSYAIDYLESGLLEITPSMIVESLISDDEALEQKVYDRSVLGTLMINYVESINGSQYLRLSYQELLDPEKDISQSTLDSYAVSLYQQMSNGYGSDEDKKDFINYLKSNYEYDDDLTFVDMLDLTREMTLEAGKPFAEVAYKQNRNRALENKLDEQAKRSIIDVYFAWAFPRGRPIGPQHFSRILTNNKWSFLETPSKSVQELTTDQMSIIYLAYKSDNYELFQYFDQKYDLNSVKNGDGTPLSERMQSKGTILNREEFVSEDFGLSTSNPQFLRDQISNIMTFSDVEIIEAYKSSINVNDLMSYELESMAVETRKQGILDLYAMAGLSINSPISVTGGTLLHFCVDYIKEVTDIGYNDLDFIADLNLDKALKDTNGNTAFDYLKKNKKAITKKKYIGSYEIEYKGGLLYDSVEVFIKD